MAPKFGKNRNTNDTATVNVVTINSTTSTVIALANPLRQFLYVGMPVGGASLQAYVKLQPAAADNTAKGILLTNSNPSIRGEGAWEMSTDSVYTGEVSAISTGGTFDLHIVEY